MLTVILKRLGMSVELIASIKSNLQWQLVMLTLAFVAIVTHILIVLAIGSGESKPTDFDDRSFYRNRSYYAAYDEWIVRRDAAISEHRAGCICGACPAYYTGEGRRCPDCTDRIKQFGRTYREDNPVPTLNQF